MGQDVDGFCRILREAGHTVLTKDVTIAQPRLGNLPNTAADEVLEIYRALGGAQPSPTLRPGSWDVLVDDVLVELDEQLHFNRYRSLTLTAGSYEHLPRFPLADYRTFCAAKEGVCLKLGQGQKRWTSDSTEAQFGPSAPRGDLSGAGAPRWKQRALYDLIKDLTQLDSQAPPLARISIWDRLPGLPATTVEAAVHRAPTPPVTDALRRLIGDRSGRSMSRR
jgi:hypothetical protein